MINRIEFVDLAKDFCILFVVMLHVFGDSAGRTMDLLNLFRMPLYFVLSGIFFKAYSDFGEFFRKKINKLVIPFLITYFIICLPSIFIFKYDLYIYDTKRLGLGIDGAVWFLLCLFIVNIFFYTLFLLCRHKFVYISISSVIIGFIGYSLNIFKVQLPFWIDSSMTALPFFCFGYFLRNKTLILNEETHRQHKIWAYMSFVALLSSYIAGQIFKTNIISYGDNSFDINIVSLYLGGISGFYLTFYISKRIKTLPVISYIGRYSIVILITHLIYLFALRNILYHLHVNQEPVFVNALVFIVVIILSLPTIRLGIKYCPHWFAQKDIF